MEIPGQISAEIDTKTIRTARARTSEENLLVVLLVMAPPSQELEPPINPERFTSL